MTNLRPVTINPKTGKSESVLANMEAIYPEWPQMNSEMSFEELRAAHRGWLHKDWAREKPERVFEKSDTPEESTLMDEDEPPNTVDVVLADEVAERLLLEEEHESQIEDNFAREGSREQRSTRPKKMKIMEVKGEPQTGITSNQGRETC